METPLTISTEHLNPDGDTDRVFNMAGRCAFAVCVKGDFDVRILNEEYHVYDHCMFACMPFVNVKVVRVNKPSEILFGYLLIDEVPSMINRLVNTGNMITIQQRPLVRANENQFRDLDSSIKGFLCEISESQRDASTNSCRQIHNEVIDLHSRLIVAQVLKIYFTNVSMDVKGHTHRDIVFQRFMLDLYANFREHRNVQFYARRSDMSMKYFSTIIRQLSGLSPSEWIEHVVVGEAKSMLNEVHRNIKDIAASLNFPDAPTFTKYFRRVAGVTPKVYRQTIIP